MLKSKTLIVAGLSLALAACGGNTVKKEQQVEQANINNDDFYEVHHEGRIYLFDDFATYQSFNEVGETAYRKVYIGEGPKGETLVFGLTKEDKKKTSGIASIDMFNGELAPAESFYAEMRLEGRIYVLDSMKELNSLRQVGEAPYRFTEIGTGPEGETVVYVLRKEVKKQKPVALQAAFKKRNGLM
ncbi:MAG: hypothetical protein OQK12_12845 [Motiliproteus sp.]|nr:hypothetical protein [Motiliproteus sp.]MCW9053790.1 hypothetical protein [Motiliproteus sp.]